MLTGKPFELVCPAGALPSLKAAVDNGADWVYLGLRDDTNARNFPGLNFDDGALAEGLAYAHRHGRKVAMAINTYPQAANWPRWTAAVDRAAALGRLRDAALAGENLFAVLMDTVRSCSLGEITETLFEVGGQYRRNM